MITANQMSKPSKNTLTVEQLFPLPKFTIAPKVRVIENILCVITRLDTTLCRSPSRALRRYRAGITGRVRRYEKPTALFDQKTGIMFAHPQILRGIERRMTVGAAVNTDAVLYDALYGDPNAKKTTTDDLLTPTAAGTRAQW
jgi:hypothetical protein